MDPFQTKSWAETLKGFVKGGGGSKINIPT